MGEASGAPEDATHTSPPKEEVVIREATAADLGRLDTLTLADFATDFSKVPIPDRDGPLTDGEMRTAVDAFVQSLTRT
jgi:hypothetical protein